MRAIIILVVIVLLMVLAGWLVIDIGGNRATVELRPEKIEQDADKAVENSKQLLHQADDAVNKQ